MYIYFQLTGYCVTTPSKRFTNGVRYIYYEYGIVCIRCVCVRSQQDRITAENRATTKQKTGCMSEEYITYSEERKDCIEAAHCQEFHMY